MFRVKERIWQGPRQHIFAQVDSVDFLEIAELIGDCSREG